MKPEEKLKYFDYFLFKLLEHYSKENKNTNNNDFSVLKSMKLLFFVTAIDTSNPLNLLDNVFDNFCAMPYGHVESDVYDQIKRSKGILNLNIIDSQKTEQKTFDISLLNLELKYTDLIDKNINKLVQNYPNLIKLKAFQLVDLSHKWYSWIQAISDAQKEQSWSKLIDREMIKKEQKIFTLSQY